MRNQKTSGMGRREFIVLTSTTALAAAAFGKDLLPQPAAASAVAREFSLGYVEPDASLRGTGRGLTPNVMSVDSVSSGDGNFLTNGVKVSVRGYNVMPKSPTGRVQMQLIVQYLESGTRRVDPFVAWRYSRNAGGASPISFLVPVDQDQNLHLLFTSDSEASIARKAAQAPSDVSRRDILTGASAAASLEAGADPGAINLTLMSGKSDPKLRRGYYIISPVGEGVGEPDWSRYELRTTDNGMKLFEANNFNAGPAQIEYMILFIDYFAPSERDKVRIKKVN
ncbi:MAG TPA: hypothetical protein VF219_19190 [Vicinamibacterales bacterium]